METNAITAAGTSAATTGSTASDKARSALTSDFATFLQMLTTQARYQDPLDPIDSTEFSAQLAQFSMVEQQVQTNSLMEQLIGALSVSETSNLAGWIGMEALSEAPTRYSGAPVTVLPNVPVGAEELFLVVRNDAGTVVDTRQIPVSETAYAWDGRGLGGTALPDGNYLFSVEARARGEIIDTAAARTYGAVIETRLEDGKTLIGLSSGAFVEASEVGGLRPSQ